MKRFIVATQVVDPDHPFLGANISKFRALAERVEELVVLADHAVANALPSNCTVRTFGSGSRERRAWRFLSALEEELRPRPIGVLAHMVGRFALLAAPLVRPRRIPLVLWINHWKPSRTLALAARVSSAIVSVDVRSFPVRSSKVVSIGNCVDVGLFACAERAPTRRLQVVSVGRTSPAKGFETIARACELAGAELEVVGASSTDEERDERARLASLGVHLGEPRPHALIPALLAGKDVLVDNMREGALDKVVYEAAATCMPVLASGGGFDAFLPAELRYRRDDPVDLAGRLRWLATVDRAAIGRQLRERVVAEHSAGHWADRVLEVAAG